MQECNVYFDTIEQVRQLVDLAMVQPYGIYLGQEGQWVSAKSFIGLFSLDLRKEQTLRAECSEGEFARFREALDHILA